MRIFLGQDKKENLNQMMNWIRKQKKERKERYFLLFKKKGFVQTLLHLFQTNEEKRDLWGLTSYIDNSGILSMF